MNHQLLKQIQINPKFKALLIIAVIIKLIIVVLVTTL